MPHHNGGSCITVTGIHILYAGCPQAPNLYIYTVYVLYMACTVMMVLRHSIFNCAGNSNRHSTYDTRQVNVTTIHIVIIGLGAHSNHQLCTSLQFTLNNYIGYASLLNTCSFNQSSFQESTTCPTTTSAPPPGLSTVGAIAIGATLGLLGLLVVILICICCCCIFGCMD